MSLWFNDPYLRSIIPLGLSSSIRGLTTLFNTPKVIMGSNVFPEGLVIGPSTVDFLGSRCVRKQAFIVTDEFSERFTPKIVRVLEAGGFETEVWAKALPEAPLDSVRACGEAMTGFEPDLIMAVGGGSVIDTAKGAWIFYERPEITDLTLVTPLELLGLRKKAVFAGVPTTSGTGSECTTAAVIHDEENHRKIPIANDDLMPDFAILVPEFTMSMPPALTAGTGLDVLAHSMDAVMSAASNEVTDAMSLSAIKMAFRYLPRAYRNGKDREARSRMLLAASLAGIGFGNAGTALTHSFGHTAGSIFNIHHGLAVGLFIPYVFQFYRDISNKYLEICDILEVGGDTPEERFDGLIERVRTLFQGLDVPLCLKDLGIKKAAFDENMEKMVVYTFEDIDTIFSPRPITSAQCEKIFRCAFEGTDVNF
jgi:alcohol dehydrogenase class IV